MQYITTLGNYHLEDLEKVGHNANDYGTLVRVFAFDEAKRLRRLDIEEKWFQEDIQFASLEHNPIPNHKTAVTDYWEQDPTGVWQKCPQNPWTVFSHDALDQEAIDQAMSLEGSLIFNTTIASLTLRHRQRYTDRSVVDICDADGKDVGRMQRMTNTWMRDRIDLKRTYQFIVLCAGVLPKLERRGPLRDRENWDTEGYMDHLWHKGLLAADPINRHFRMAERDPWLLRLMMVEEDTIKKRVFRRIAVGFVETRCWVYCRPQWSTVVLA